MAQEVGQPERMMSAREVGDALGLSVNTVKRIPRRDLPFYRVTPRGDRRYYPTDVARYVKTMTTLYEAP